MRNNYSFAQHIKQRDFQIQKFNKVYKNKLNDDLQRNIKIKKNEKKTNTFTKQRT